MYVYSMYVHMYVSLSLCVCMRVCVCVLCVCVCVYMHVHYYILSVLQKQPSCRTYIPACVAVYSHPARADYSLAVLALSRVGSAWV